MPFRDLRFDVAPPLTERQGVRSLQTPKAESPLGVATPVAERHGGRSLQNISRELLNYDGPAGDFITLPGPTAERMGG